MTPPLAGYEMLGRSPVPRDFPQTPTASRPLLLVGLARELSVGAAWRPWRLEGDLGWVLDGKYPRALVVLRAGPSIRLGDSRGKSGRGSLLALQAQGGLAYRGLAYDVYDNRHDGQRSLGATLLVGVEGIRFTSRAFGWCARLRSAVSTYPLHQGPARWYSGSGSAVGESVRWTAGLQLDLGVAL